MNFVCRGCERDNEVYDEQLMEWMRERVRCETCKHWHSIAAEGGNCRGFGTNAWRHSKESCATHWEPKEG